MLDILNKGYIDKQQYKDFGLFYDDKITDFEGKDLKKRLKDNALYFNRVDEIHNYGNPETQLEKYFDDNGISKLKNKDWMDIEYKTVKKSIENKVNTILEYKSSSEEWERAEGSSKAKSRVRNIIVFNEQRKDEVELEFYFDDYLKNEYIYKTEGEVEAKTSGYKLKVTIKDIEGKSNFYKVVYKQDNLKFEFKIAMFRCSSKYFESIKSKYTLVVKKKEQYISINTNESEVIFNEFADGNTVYEVDSNDDVIEVLDDDKLIVKISDRFQYESDKDLVRFDLKIGEERVPLGIVGTSEKTTPIEGFKVWKLKREKQCDFRLIGENKLQHGTKEYFTRDEFRKNLEIEKQILELEGLYFEENSEGIEVLDLDIDISVKKAYRNIINYYKMSRKLPSLTYLNDDLIKLYKVFVKEYIDVLNRIDEGSYLTKKQKNLFKIGTIKRNIEDRELIFTPLHPLNIVYQLHINYRIGSEEMNDDVLKKFTSTYLLPYIIDADDKLSIPMEQSHSSEWKYYVDEKLPRYKSSRDFVAKLVNEKIEEFTTHFKYMFEMGNNAPIKINLINTGDCKEILQGIFKYYVKQLKSSKNKDILPIDIYIYSSKNITNAFEEVAFNENIESLKEIYKLDLSVDSMSQEEVLNLYRQKVHFYSKDMNEGIEYAHITFFEMSNDIKTITSNMDDIPSGVIFNGNISGVPSVFL